MFSAQALHILIERLIYIYICDDALYFFFENMVILFEGEKEFCRGCDRVDGRCKGSGLIVAKPCHLTYVRIVPSTCFD